MQLRDRIAAFASGRQFRPASIERWLGLDDADAAALLQLAETLRVSENQWRDLFDCAEEIALRDTGTVAAVLDANPVRAALDRGLGRNDALKAAREALRRLRYPQLARLEDELAQRVRALGLPPGVRLVLPEHLQDDEIRFEVRGRDAADVRRVLGELCAAARRPELDEIFALLREAP